MTILHLLAAYGLCFGLMNDKAVFFTNRLRELSPAFQRMLDCAYCTGFHCGWLICLVSGRAHHLTDLILWAFASSAFCYGADAWVRWLESRSGPPAGS